MAASVPLLEEVLTNRESRIVALETMNEDQYRDFQDLLRVTNEKLQLQKEITAHTESISNTYQEEKKALKKQVRRLKWQRAGLAALTVLVVVVSL